MQFVHPTTTCSLIEQTVEQIDFSTTSCSLQYGRSGMGKSWVLTHAAAFAAKRSGLRTVNVSRQEAKALDKLLDEVRLHPNVRFAVLLDDLTFKAGDEAGAAFKQLLEGSFEVGQRQMGLSRVLVHEVSRRSDQCLMGRV